LQTAKIKNTIEFKLNNLRTKSKLYILFSGILNLVFYFCTFVFFCTVIELLFHFYSWIRIIIMILFIGAGFYFIVFIVIIPLYSLLFRKNVPDNNTLALKVGNFFPDIGDRLANSLQVFSSSEKNRYGTSEELAQYALVSAVNQSEKYDFRESVSKKIFIKPLRYALISIVITSFFFLLFYTELSGSFNRLVHPFSHYSSSPSFSLALFPGNATIVQGEDVEISLKIDGILPETVFLYYRFEDINSVFNKEELTPPFIKRFNSVRKSFEYFAKADKMETSHFNVNVVIRPLIKKLQLKLIPPAYSKLPAEIPKSNRGDIECLKGTQAELSIEGNKPLSEVKIDFKNRKDIQLKVNSNKGHGQFFIWQPDSYFVSLKDSLGLNNDNPISYSITIESDYPPVVNILSPEKSMDLDEGMLIPLVIDAGDDFGISDIRIGYSVYQGNEQDSTQSTNSFIRLPVDINEPPELRVDFNWMVDTLDLFPEDIIHYFVEVFDNDRISGPKKTKTSLFSARFPSMAEIFREVSTKQVQQLETLEGVYEKSERVEKELDEISKELKSEGELDWEEKKNVEQMSKQQQDFKQKMRDLSREMEDIINQLEKNQMISPETLEKYEELQRLYQEFDSPELQKVLQELSKVMEDIDPERLRRSINNFQMAQKNFQRAIERTISLLKQIKVEQESEALVKRLQELTDRQREINKQLFDKQNKNVSDQIRNEEMIKSDTKRIREDMDELYNDMTELSHMPLSQMKAVMDSVDREKLSEKIEKMISLMKSGKNSQAGKSGEKVKKAMQSITQMMQNVSETLKKMQKNRVAKSLQRSTYDLLQISQEQESLIQTRQKGKITKSKAAVQQTGLISGLDQVVDSLMALSKKTLFITPEIGRALGKAKFNMQEALQNMSTNQKGIVSNYQGKAVGSLNQGVMAIEEVLEKIEGSGSGFGMNEFLMQMEQMAGEQSRLNKQTMDMLDRGKLSLAQQAAMSRLAQQQQAIKESVQKFLQELGSDEQYAGRLDKTLEEMHKVIKDLQEKNINQETIERQQHILSRMLDLQHSVRKRDYSNKRLSTTGKEIIRTSPEELYFDKSSLEKQIRRDILRLSEEGYTKQFQKLIREYYHLLFQERTVIQEKNN